MANLDWLVVRDFSLIETADVLAGRPRDRDRASCAPRTSPPRSSSCRPRRTPRRTARFTNTQRLLQWHHKAVEPAGRRAQRPVVLLPPRAAHPRRSSPGPTDESDRPRPRPHLGLPDRGRARRARAPRRCSREINGCGRRRPAAARPTPSWQTTGRPRAAAGSTAAATPTGSTRPRAASRATQQNWVAPRVGLGVAGQPAHPLQPRLGRPRRQAVERAQGATSGGTTTSGEWTGHDVAGLRGRQAARTTCPPEGASGADAIAGDDPFIMQADGRGWLFAPAGLADGPLPTHYEPQESPVRNPLYGQQRNPARQMSTAPGQPLPARRRRAGRRRVPLRRHHLPADRAPHRGRHEPVTCPTWPSCSPSSSARSHPRSRPSAGSSTAAGRRSSPRAAPSRRACWSPTACARCRSQGRRSTRSACPTTGARAGYTTGDSANELCSTVARPERAHPGGQGARLRHPARPPAARARAARARRASTSSGPGSPTKPGRRCRRGQPSCRPGRAGTRSASLPDIPNTRHAWASSPTRRCASAARRARWPARSGTHVPEDGLDCSPACRTTTPARSAPTPGATWRSSSSASAAGGTGCRAGAGDGAQGRRLPLADVLATCASTARTPRASTCARPARCSAPSSAPSSCRRTSATAAATASPPARTA